jgi:hypothetical protein
MLRILNRSETIRDCKLKRVYPRLPLHVHSAGQKRLAESASGNPSGAEGAAGGTARASEWTPDRLRVRLERELSREAWRLLKAAVRRRGTSVEKLLCDALAEAS